jgi:hypothetical protein
MFLFGAAMPSRDHCSTKEKEKKKKRKCPARV